MESKLSSETYLIDIEETVPEKELMHTLSPFLKGTVDRTADVFARSPKILLYPERGDKLALFSRTEAAVIAAYKEILG